MSFHLTSKKTQRALPETQIHDNVAPACTNPKLMEQRNHFYIAYYAKHGTFHSAMDIQMMSLDVP